jgi:L-ribulokinase
VALVAGVDFGTQSVRVSIFDGAQGRLGIGSAAIPLPRKKSDPDYATQSHSDPLDALLQATQAAIASAKIDSKEIEAIAVDTTGSSVVPVGHGLEPLDDCRVGGGALPR